MRDEPLRFPIPLGALLPVVVILLSMTYVFFAILVFIEDQMGENLSITQDISDRLKLVYWTLCGNVHHILFPDDDRARANHTIRWNIHRDLSGEHFSQPDKSLADFKLALF